MPFAFFGFRPEGIEADDHGERVIAAVDAFIRRTGWTHSRLAERAEVEPARVSLFLTRAWPGDWIEIATALDRVLLAEADRERREAAMPTPTPVVRKTLGLAKLVMEDGGIGLVQGDSGVGKTEAIRAVALRHPKSVSILAATCRALPKPMLEDIGARMGCQAYGRHKADAYRIVVDALPNRCELLIVDESHRYIGKPDCLQTLADLLKETNVPQLWTATGDLLRYLNRPVGRWADPFAQIRSRITHQLDLNIIREAGNALANDQDIQAIARTKFGMSLDAGASRDLAELADEPDEGGIRVIETILKEVRRLAANGMDVREAVRRSIERRAGKRTKSRRQGPADVAQPVTTPAKVRAKAG
jgi:DNA transposition AAA+ family ATPase